MVSNVKKLRTLARELVAALKAEHPHTATGYTVKDCGQCQLIERAEPRVK